MVDQIFLWVVNGAMAAASLLFPAAASASPQTITPEFLAKVIYVDDGDTVIALREGNEKVKVRLANIDAPETNHGRCRPGQPWSDKSTAALKDLVHGRTVLFTCSTLDRYGRSVCDVHLGVRATDDTANRELVRHGLAWANRANPSYLRDPAVASAERSAQAARIGIWSDSQSIPPWQWRHTAWDAARGGDCARYDRVE